MRADCCQNRGAGLSLRQAAATAIAWWAAFADAIVYPSHHELYKFDYPPRAHPPASERHIKARADDEKPIPLLVTNNCPDTLWPGIATQHGDGPESTGFELGPGKRRNMTVGSTWQGRVWGRTNCTADGETATCATGDCFGKLECEFSGAAPATLAEFTLSGGVTGTQTFYDISLVDGYNLPVGIVYHPAKNTTWIPPNLVNPVCIGTPGYLADSNRTGLTYTNSTYPMPYETAHDNERVSNWCPWDLQAFPPTKPGDGVYPYPDDNVPRPVFDPCKSACAATNDPRDCCAGEYNNPDVCGPSLYSTRAKAVCPDAYSYAYDDQTSTFIIPHGGGWEVVFCPVGRSTNILSTFGAELQELAASGHASHQMLLNLMNTSYIDSKPSSAGRFSIQSWGLLLSALVGAWAVGL
ncbi:thaumatin family-domain-containing protein [Microdochium trichocladiopsis]|uniref:Thaumatin family-domain-containing protein n=1 Tax=Microdochium trichocladiopsis TaxID=1682393 RepID=A0A9P8YEC1_9PEZI|nr:thaumatin family-domain-containing protein [Microdochium trichocladiopsis]KAH7037327.1 thaumatin family-domain-containing protein [Microdochium trichocladiopsis]